MFGLKLIPEWRQAYRMLSMVVAFALAVLSAVQTGVLPMVKPLFAADVFPIVAGVLAATVMVVRVIDQQLKLIGAVLPPESGDQAGNGRSGE